MYAGQTNKMCSPSIEMIIVLNNNGRHSGSLTNDAAEVNIMSLRFWGIIALCMLADMLVFYHFASQQFSV